jgi:ketosteroid isomerase-like protein
MFLPVAFWRKHVLKKERILMSEQQRQETHFPSTPKAIFESFIAAANRHDLEALVACFAPDYRGELPFTPEGNFIGQAGVRKNWSAFFSTLPDFQVEVRSLAVEGDTVWSELFFHGTQADGTKRMMQGVGIMGMQSGKIAWGRLYQNTVQQWG